MFPISRISIISHVPALGIYIVKIIKNYFSFTGSPLSLDSANRMDLLRPMELACYHPMGNSW